MIISGPQVARSGETLDAIVHVMDIAPTLLDVAGATYPAPDKDGTPVPQRGQSIVSLLTAKADTIRGADDYLAWEFFDWRGIRMANWKATWIAQPFGAGDWQLFDIARDPGESHDLADQYPDVTQDLANKWDSYADDVGVVERESTEWPVN